MHYQSRWNRRTALGSLFSCPAMANCTLYYIGSTGHLLSLMGLQSFPDLHFPRVIFLPSPMVFFWHMSRSTSGSVLLMPLLPFPHVSFVLHVSFFSSWFYFQDLVFYCLFMTNLSNFFFSFLLFLIRILRSLEIIAVFSCSSFSRYVLCIFYHMWSTSSQKFHLLTLHVQALPSLLHSIFHL